MDAGALSGWFAEGMAAAWNSPVPIGVAAAITALLLWKFLDRRYSSIIGRLREQVVYLEGAVTGCEALAATAPFDITTPGLAEREFLPACVTPAFILALHRDLTSDQASKIRASYVGKWMHASGTVLAVLPTERSTLVTLHADETAPDNPYWGPVSVFVESDSRKLHHLKKGDRASFVGQLATSSPVGMRLNHGELDI